MFDNIPGVDVDTDLTTDTSVYLVICEKDYPTILSQMGIINYIDLATDKDKHIFYRVSNGDYGRNFCPSCGAEIESHHRFCTNCGYKL